jgi:hypothetical protein
MSESFPRVLRSSDPNTAVNLILDTIVTGLLLMGGADGLAQTLKLRGEGGAKTDPDHWKVDDRGFGRQTVRDGEGRPTIALTADSGPSWNQLIVILTAVHSVRPPIE